MVGGVTSGGWKILTLHTIKEGGNEVPGKITIRNYTTLTDFAALLRAGRYLAGYQKEAESDEFRIKVTENERHGIVVKLTEVER